MSLHMLNALTARSTLPPVATVFVALAVAVTAWEERRSTRKALARLDGHMLRDIGLDARDASLETEKPFWRG